MSRGARREPGWLRVWVLSIVLCGCLQGPALDFDNPCDPGVERACNPAPSERSLPDLGLGGLDAEPSDPDPLDAERLDSRADRPPDAAGDGPAQPDARPRPIIFSCEGDPDVICMLPVADAYLDTGDPDGNFGLLEQLRVSVEGDRYQDAWILFDFEPLLLSAPFREVAVRMHFAIDVDPGTPRVQTSLGPTAWSERLVTWRTRPNDGTFPHSEIDQEQIGQREIDVSVDVTEALGALLGRGETLLALRLGYPRAGGGRGVWIIDSKDLGSRTRNPPTVVAW